MQQITYTEYLPVLLGPRAAPLTAAALYNASVSAAVSVEFTTAAFRFGHSQVAVAVCIVHKCTASWIYLLLLLAYCISLNN